MKLNIRKVLLVALGVQCLSTVPKAPAEAHAAAEPCLIADRPNNYVSLNLPGMEPLNFSGSYFSGGPSAAFKKVGSACAKALKSGICGKCYLSGAKDAAPVCRITDTRGNNGYILLKAPGWTLGQESTTWGQLNGGFTKLMTQCIELKVLGICGKCALQNSPKNPPDCAIVSTKPSAFGGVGYMKLQGAGQTMASHKVDSLTDRLAILGKLMGVCEQAQVAGICRSCAVK